MKSGVRETLSKKATDANLRLLLGIISKIESGEDIKKKAQASKTLLKSMDFLGRLSEKYREGTPFFSNYNKFYSTVRDFLHTNNLEDIKKIMGVGIAWLEFYENRGVLPSGFKDELGIAAKSNENMQAFLQKYYPYFRKRLHEARTGLRKAPKEVGGYGITALDLAEKKILPRLVPTGVALQLGIVGDIIWLAVLAMAFVIIIIGLLKSIEVEDWRPVAMHLLIALVLVFVVWLFFKITGIIGRFVRP